MLDELLAAEGVEEVVRLEGSVGFMALHGGLETATCEIAEQAATASGASLYSVQQPWSMYWHVPSVMFDPAQSPALTSFLTHVQVVFSIHGFGRPGLEASLLCGGANRPLAGRVADSLRGAGFDAIDEMHRIPEKLRGTHVRNPVNLAPHGGVQIEVGNELRTEAHIHGALSAVLASVAATEMRSLCARSDCE